MNYINTDVKLQNILDMFVSDGNWIPKQGLRHFVCGQEHKIFSDLPSEDDCHQ